MSQPFTRTFTAGPEHIDVMGHVNNAVWVQWVQDMATAHWDAVADPQHARDFVWLVVRHEIDYRGNIGPGDAAWRLEGRIVAVADVFDALIVRPI